MSGAVVDWDALRARALEVMERAHAPFSGYRVGAAGLVDDGRVVVGCNVENASYGVTLCAECGMVSSLHATEAVSALYRLLDMGIEAFLIASSVSAVMAQRLVRRSCTSCLETYVPSAEELAFLRSIGGAEPVGGFRRGSGCHYCSGTGYLERIGVYELLVVTDAMRELIVDRAPQDSLRKLARCEGMKFSRSGHASR